MTLARFPISDIELRDVVHDFYAAIRAHPVLGPVFGAHVKDWPEHEEKIIAFWRNAILLERSYDGNPMLAHREAGNVNGPMFPVWLGLFDSVLNRELRADQATAWSALAHRIGSSLRMGVEGGLRFG